MVPDYSGAAAALFLNEKRVTVDKNKQFAINMIAQVVGFVVMMGISFLLTPFIVEHVGSEAYGFVGLANNFVSYAQVITVALNSMASRFITIKITENDVEGSNRYFTSVVIANIVTALVLSVPSAIIILNLNKIVNVSEAILIDVQWLWAFIFLNFLVSIISSTYSVATFVRNKLYLTSLQGIISNILRVAVLIAAFSFFVPSVWYVGLAAFVATVYVYVWNVYYTRILTPDIKVRKRYFDVKVIKVLLSSGIWNSFTRLSSILSTGLDLLVTNLYVSSAAMGVLSVAKTVPSAILTLFGTLASVYAPQLTHQLCTKGLQGNEEPVDVVDKIPRPVRLHPGSGSVRLRGNLLQIVGADPGCASLVHADDFVLHRVHVRLAVGRAVEPLYSHK